MHNGFNSLLLHLGQLVHLTLSLKSSLVQARYLSFPVVLLNVYVHALFLFLLDMLVKNVLKIL